jgi:hypothetical protein
MSPVLSRPRARAAPALFRRDVLIATLAAVITISALFLCYTALQGPRFVDRVTVVNTTPYLADIEVTSQTRDGWLKLGPVSPGEQHDFGSVVDQGDRWIFHVTTGPHDGGEFSLTKNELEHQQWRIVIPLEVHHRLETDGAVPHPDQ